MLLSFIATFLVIVIKNRLKVMNSFWVAAPNTDKNLKDLYLKLIIEKNNKNRTLTGILEEQESFPEVFKISVKELFKELKSYKADIFESALIMSR